MTKTFTPETTKTDRSAPKTASLPSERTIANILAYSRNLEVRESRIVPFVSYLKS